MKPVCVAIPARDEADRIGACLAALATQRDTAGVPLPDGSFTVIVFANNCTDDTAGAAERWGADGPHPVRVVVRALPPVERSAGWARRHAMDCAAGHLERIGATDGVILTTDADSCVGPTWIAATMAAVEAGADGVAGYVDAHPAEIVALGPAFLARGRLEDRYLSAIAELYALVDPVAGDPWPNHRVSSGASLAVTLAAYRAIGGLPPIPVGEDAALTRALELAGFTVRHSMDVIVSTSCRFDGRARGGAADTMRERHAAPDAPCDPDMEDARATLRRAVARRRLRAAQAGPEPAGRWATRCGLEPEAAAVLAAMLGRSPFLACWERLVAASPVLGRRTSLRPSDLPGQIARIERLIRRLRGPGQAPGRTSRSSR